MENVYLCAKSRVENVRRTHKTRQENVFTPVEWKATTGNANLMRTVLKQPEKYHVTSALKLGNYNIGRSDDLLTLPMYMAFLLTEI